MSGQMNQKENICWMAMGDALWRGRLFEGNGMMNGMRVACGTIEGGALTKAANLHEFIESIVNAIPNSIWNATHFPGKKRH